MTLTDWLTVLVIGCFAVMSPGPNLLITLRNSLAYSRCAGVLTALGLALGNSVHVTYGLVGIAVVIAQSILLFTVIKWLGAAYLIFIGVLALRSRGLQAEGCASAAQPAKSPIGAIRDGFLTSILNPKVTLFFLALFTQVIEPQTPTAVQAVYGATIVGLELFWYSAVALIVAQSRIKVAFFAAGRWIDRITGTLFIALGIRLAFARAAE